MGSFRGEGGLDNDDMNAGSEYFAFKVVDGSSISVSEEETGLGVMRVVIFSDSKSSFSFKFPK